MPRPNVFEPDQTNAGDSKSRYQFGPKRGGQRLGEHGRLNAVIHQNPPLDQTANDWDFHCHVMTTAFLVPS
jgi:hypothetical protein